MYKLVPSCLFYSQEIEEAFSPPYVCATIGADIPLIQVGGGLLCKAIITQMLGIG
jgi:hypothetical protein